MTWLISDHQILSLKGPLSPVKAAHFWKEVWESIENLYLQRNSQGCREVSQRKKWDQLLQICFRTDSMESLSHQTKDIQIFQIYQLNFKWEASTVQAGAEAIALNHLTIQAPVTSQSRSKNHGSNHTNRSRNLNHPGRPSCQGLVRSKPCNASRVPAAPSQRPPRS
jgi:hypothetical protein